MSDVSSTRRKFGLAAIGAGALLALPMTASISYAQAEAPLPPAVPQAGDATAPQALRSIVTIRREQNDETVSSDMVDDPSRNHRRAIVRPDGETHGGIDEAEIARMMAEIETGMAGLEDIDDIVAQATEGSRAGIQLATQAMPRVEAGCDNAGEVISHRQLADGSRVMVICQRAAYNEARHGLREAQRAIREATEIPPETRDMILRQLEAEIDSLGREQAMADFAAVALASLEQMEKQATRFALIAPPAPPAAPASPAPPVQVVLIRASVVAPVVEVSAVPTI